MGEKVQSFLLLQRVDGEEGCSLIEEGLMIFGMGLMLEYSRLWVGWVLRRH